MNRMCAAIVSLALLSAAPGCVTQARQPKLLNAMIDPGTLYPGQEKALITVEVQDDRHGIIDRIEWRVDGYPEYVFELRDDGAQGDEAAGDGVWSMLVDVPFNTPKGEFTLHLAAYDSEGRPIMVRDPEAGSVPLTTAFTAVVEYASER